MASEFAHNWTLDPSVTFLNTARTGRPHVPCSRYRRRGGSRWSASRSPSFPATSSQRWTNRDLALRGRDLLCDALAIERPAPDDMIGSMAAVPLPLESGNAQVQVIVTPWAQRPDGGSWRRLIRISAAPYVGLEDLARLANALPAILTTA